jgi:hypothetical protein
MDLNQKLFKIMQRQNVLGWFCFELREYVWGSKIWVLKKKLAMIRFIIKLIILNVLIIYLIL